MQKTIPPRIENERLSSSLSSYEWGGRSEKRMSKKRKKEKTFSLNILKGERIGGGQKIGEEKGRKL